MSIIINGKNGIRVEVVKDSINEHGDRITTLLLDYHRYIHSHILRHRTFSHSVSSSRAIPSHKVADHVQDHMAIPTYWGENKAGMSAEVELQGDDREEAVAVWNNAARDALDRHEEFMGINLHKQVANRILESFEIIRDLVTGTEFDNFFWLRDHKAAQPEIRELAMCMKEAMHLSTPSLLQHDMYHLPFISNDELTAQGLVQAKRTSVSCCAQTSYRNLDKSREKTDIVLAKLMPENDAPIHWSPYEHVANPFSEDERFNRQEIINFAASELPGIAMDQAMFSGNLRGWTQLRKSIESEGKI